MRLLRYTLLSLLLTLTPMANGRAEERHASFDTDPQWEGHNNSIGQDARREVQQDFGYSSPAKAVGGTITPANEPAYYAKKIPVRSLNTPLSASGKVQAIGKNFNVLIGFFNGDTLGGWRTPNTLVLRIYGRGDHFYAYLEYATRLGRAGGDSPKGFTVKEPDAKKPKPILFPRTETLSWSLRYDPSGNGGKGVIHATLGAYEAECDLNVGHRQDGATMNRFGLLNVMKSVDGGGEVWLRDVVIEGKAESFDHDPKWEGYNNRRNYSTAVIRPKFNFGYSNTHLAGGASKGEIGGLIFRGDARFANKLASYADRLEPLTLDKPLKASGKIAFVRGVSDSTTLFGFFHSARSHRVQERVTSGFPACFLGLALEGPSSEGFYLYPVLQFADKGEHGRGLDPPHIYPDGSSHAWALEYQPQGSGRGTILLTFDGKMVKMEVTIPKEGEPLVFDRFGIITTCVDGNGQFVYWDDLNYTFRQ